MKLLKIFCARTFVASLFACASFAAMAQQTVLTNRDTELRAAPDDTAAILQILRDKTPVQVLQRRGPWSQTKAGSSTGWVRMMHLRGGSSVVVEEQSSSGGFFSSFNRLLLGDRERAAQSKQSATVGIRGFSREDVERAELNPAELAKLKGYQVTEADARQFASQRRLTFRSVAYLAQDAVEAASAQGAKK